MEGDTEEELDEARMETTDVEDTADVGAATAEATVGSAEDIEKSMKKTNNQRGIIIIMLIIE